MNKRILVSLLSAALFLMSIVAVHAAELWPE